MISAPVTRYRLAMCKRNAEAGRTLRPDRVRGLIALARQQGEEIAQLRLQLAERDRTIATMRKGILNGDR